MQINPQKRVESTEIGKNIIKALNEKYEETVNGKILVILRRQFPVATRFLFRVRTETQRVQYIVQRNKETKEITVVERVVLKDNLKPLTNPQVQICEVQEEITGCIVAENQEEEPTKEDKKTKIEEEEETVISVIRENNPEIEDLKVIKVWRRNFIKTR